MFNSPAIEVCLGLIFIFLLYSLLATTLQEMLARWFGLRARTLLKALRRMLEDGDSKFDKTLITVFIDIGNNMADYFKPLKNNTFLKAFYDNPTIKYLGENNTNSKPSYLNADNFSQALIHILRGEAFNNSQNQMNLIRNNLNIGKINGFTINPQTLKTLSRIWTDANNDIDSFKAGLEKWFNATMDRATGWYTRQTRLLLFLIGFGLAYSFNVDSIAISKILVNKKEVREQIVSMAATNQKKLIPALQSFKDSVRIDTTTKTTTVIKYVPLKDSALEAMSKDLQKEAASLELVLGLGDGGKYKAEFQPDPGTKFVGWLLTAFAISLGAPFWFDLLNKIMTLRNAGAKETNKSTTNEPNRSATIKPVG